jgi:uncharacterized protein YgfB (UPF0149 family)
LAADYNMTRELLEAHQVPCSVAEVHGVICGQLCADEAGFDLNLATNILAIPEAASDVINSLLKMLAEDAEQQLAAGDFGFQPLLPEDDEDIGTRLSALSDWCDGFTTGFAGAWIREDGDMTEETREVLSDFARIAQLEAEDDASDRENEVNLMEITEYVRMAAITLFLHNGAKRRRPASGEDPGPDVELH